MKKTLFAIVLLVAATFASIGQITEGKVIYEIDVTTDDPEMEMALSMMQGSTMAITFKDDNTRTEMNMGSMMSITTITKSDSDGALMLMSGMIGKKAVKTSLSELESAKDETPEFDLTLLDDTKEIEGYTCNKAILTTEDGIEAVFWYTKEIDVSKKGQSYLNEQVPGFPMEFEINQGPMKMAMLVTSFEKGLGKKTKGLFDMEIPEGYDEITMEDLKTMGM